MHRENWMKRLSVMVMTMVAGVAGLSLSGCNTTEGFGEDLEAAGDSISDEAEDAN